MRKLGFGFMRLPLINQEDAGNSSVDFNLLNDMVDMYLERGFTYFDTAYMYHGGFSERALKESVVKRFDREIFTITDKMPIAMMERGEEQEGIFNEQLERCGVDYFDYYLLHNLGKVNYKKAEAFNSFEFIKQKKEEGKVKKIGFSYHDNADLLDEILTAHPEIDVVQLQINYLDWDNESIQSGKCYETAVKHKKPVIVMEPVKGGFLADVPKEAENLFKSFSPDMSVSSWAIRFAASNENVMVVLSGMSNMEQLEDNTAYMQKFEPLSEEEKQIVRNAAKIIDGTIAVACTACQYCVDDCPKNIAIPKYFALYNTEMQVKPKGFSLQKVYYDNYILSHGKASDCIKCRKCEKLCPQLLPITDYLQDVKQAFEI